MKTRTKWFLGVLAASVLAASVVAKQPQILIMALMLFGAGWLAWRCFVFLSLLLKPVRQKIKPQVDSVNAHVDTALRRSGLGDLAGMANKFQAGLDGAVDATQKNIDERSK